MFGCLRNCGIDLEIYRTSILSAVLAFIPHFPGGSGKSEMPKSTSGLTSALIYFLFGLFKHAFSGNKRHICSLERQITGRWSPDIILYGQGKQKRELADIIQSIHMTRYSAPAGFSVLPHRWLLFVYIFRLQRWVKSSMIVYLEKSLCVTWCGV